MTQQTLSLAKSLERFAPTIADIGWSDSKIDHICVRDCTIDYPAAQGLIALCDANDILVFIV